MRADRLISIVMLLQTHEKMTAEQLARETEVSQRTIYRDITALNTSGIPIYTDRGPGGGIALLESYRTSLTGMSEDEARALFMMNIPDALVELGIGEVLKSAWLKLGASLPASQQSIQAQTQQRIYLDSTPWEQKDEAAAHINVLHQAVWQDRLIRLVYKGKFNTQIEIKLAPLGLVAKMNTWYLVGKQGQHMRVVRISDILHVESLKEVYHREDKFDLVASWKDWCRVSQDQRSVYTAQVKVSLELFARLELYLGESTKYTVMENANEKGGEGCTVSVYFDNFFEAREKILSMGRAVEVLEPEALKLSVIDFAKQIVDYYQENN